MKSVIILSFWAEDRVNLILLFNLLVSLLVGYYYYQKTLSPFYTTFLIVIETCCPVFSTVGFILYPLVHFAMRKFYEKTINHSFRLPFGEEHYRSFILQNRFQITSEYRASKSQEILHDSAQIEPFLDIIEGDDVELKINAIGKLSAVRTKESITLLKVALEDSHYEVRYFASNSLTLMEKSIISEIEAYNQNISRFSNDAQNYTLRGLAYLNMYYLGIIDKAIGRVFLDQALFNFLHSLQINPDQQYLYVKIPEVYIYQKEFAKVLEIIPSILEKKLPPEEEIKVLFYKAEAHFNLNQFHELKIDCRQIASSPVKVPLMQESVQLWGSFS